MAFLKVLSLFAVVDLANKNGRCCIDEVSILYLYRIASEF